MPNAVVVRMGDGSELMLPSNKEENADANKLVAAQIRSLLQAQIRKYRESDETITPQQLRDLAQAGSFIAKFSGEVYAASEPIRPSQGPKSVDDAIDEVDFGKMAQGKVEVAQDDPPNGNPPA